MVPDHDGRPVHADERDRRDAVAAAELSRSAVDLDTRRAAFAADRRSTPRTTPDRRSAPRPI